MFALFNNSAIEFSLLDKVGFFTNGTNLHLGNHYFPSIKNRIVWKNIRV